MYIDTLIINYTAKCERCVPFLQDTDRVCANLKQNVKLICWVFKTMKRGKKDEIHNQFILQNNNIDVGKFLDLQGGWCSNESPDYYNKQNQIFAMWFQSFI